MLLSKITGIYFLAFCTILTFSGVYKPPRQQAFNGSKASAALDVDYVALTIIMPYHIRLLYKVLHL